MSFGYRTLQKVFFRKAIDRIYLSLVILALGFVTFYTSNISISSDMGWHINAAMDIYNGHGFVDSSEFTPVFRKGPLWPLFIALSFCLLGVSPWSAFWAVRIFAILNPILIYFLGKKLFGKWVGFSAALLILSSYSMNYWSYRHIDAVWPFFVLLSILFIYSAFEKKNYPFFILSAVFMGLAYLVKQAPILLFPLPFLLWALVGDYRNKRNLTGSFVYIFLITLMIFPWIYHVYSHTQNIKFALFGAGGGATAADALLKPDLFYLVKNFVLGLGDYYAGGSQSLSSSFLLAPLFVCAWIFTVYRAVRGEKASLLLAILLLLFSPYISHVGRGNLRVGQLTIFLLLTYLTAARFCLDFLKKLLEFEYGKIKLSQAILNYSIAVVVLGLIFAQTFISHKGDKGNKTFLKRSYLIQLLKNTPPELKIKGLFSKENENCGMWIKENLPSGSRLMVSRPSEGKGIYFYSDGKYPMFIMPVLQSDKLYDFTDRKFCEKVIFISSWISNDDPKNKIYMLAEEDLHKSIEQNSINYLIVNRRRNYLSIYLDNNPNFQKIKEFQKGAIKIYKVCGTDNRSDFNTLVAKRVISYLIRLKNTNSEKYNWYVHNFFGELLGWNSNRVEQMIGLNENNNIKGLQLVLNNKKY